MICRTDRAGIIGAAPWIRVPYPFQWEAPAFDAGEAFAMMAAGCFIRCSYRGSGNIVLWNFWDWKWAVGICGKCWFANIDTCRQPGLMIFFSILAKFGAIFASIPAPIIAAMYCLFFAYVGVTIYRLIWKHVVICDCC